MQLTPVLNDNMELSHYEAIEKQGTITKNITVEPNEDYFDVKEVITNGSKIIFANEFILDSKLIEAIQNI